MDYYQSLRSFVAVVETGGFASAARELRCAVSSVSKQINWLEQHMQATLLVRSTRQVTVTQQGVRVYEFAKQFFVEFEGLQEEITAEQNEVSGLLRVTAPLNLGQEIVGPQLIDFFSKHPKLTCHFILSNDFLDYQKNNIDVGFRTMALKDQNYLYRKVAIDGFKPAIYASKKYIEQYGAPLSPGEIKQHKCLVHTDSRRGRHWVFNDGERIYVQGDFETNSTPILIDAVKKGLGLAYLFRYQVRKEVESGDIVEVLQEYTVHAKGVYVCYLNKTPIAKKVSTFVDYLCDHLSSL